MKISAPKTLRPGSKYLLIAACVPALLMSSACDYYYGPHYFPTGYTYENEDYTTPPSANPVFKRRLFVEKCGHSGPCVASAASASDMMAPADFGTPNMPATAGDWNYAAVDLVNRMISGFGQPTEAIYVRKAAAGSVPEGDFENALRQALANKGATLAKEKGESPFMLDYAISPVELSDSTRQMLTVKLMNNGKAVSEVSGLYKVGNVAGSPGVMPLSIAPHPVAPASMQDDGMTPPPVADAPAPMPTPMSAPAEASSAPQSIAPASPVQTSGESHMND
jgi:hypothetical protein